MPDGKKQPWAKPLARRIKALREAKSQRMRNKFTQYDLYEAMRAHISQNDPLRQKLTPGFVSRLEQGRVGNIPRPILEALCTALDCDDKERWGIMASADRYVLVDARGELSPATLLFDRAIRLLFSNPMIHTFLELKIADQDPANIDAMNDYEVMLALAEAVAVRLRQLQQATQASARYPTMRGRR